MNKRKKEEHNGDTLLDHADKQEAKGEHTLQCSHHNDITFISLGKQNQKMPALASDTELQVCVHDRSGRNRADSRVLEQTIHRRVKKDIATITQKPKHEL